jgi:hypothetical protein
MKKRLVCLSLWAAASSFAAPRLEKKDSSSGAKLEAQMGHTTLENADGNKISGVTGSVGFLYGVNSNFGVVGKLEQAFSPANSFSTIYSLIEIGASYAVLGSLTRNRETLLLDGNAVVDTISGSGSTVRIELYANQFFLNAATSALGLAGLGAGIRYDHLVLKNLEASVGIKFSAASSSGTVIYPVHVFAGIVIPL